MRSLKHPVGVAKLYDLKPELAIENGFIESLKEMVGDANPMVVANAVTALMDIHLASQAFLESGMLFSVDCIGPPSEDPAPLLGCLSAKLIGYQEPKQQNKWPK